MKIITICALCLATIVVFGYEFSSGTQRAKKPNETWGTGNEVFQVRVNAYAEETGGFVGGAYYVFQAAPVNTDNWREIMTFRHDDMIPIPRTQIHLVNDQIGYVFMGWMYAVTTTSGSEWSVWRADKDLPNWECCNYGLIHDVHIEPDGTGTMTLHPIPHRKGEVPQLSTKDYGRHWSIE